MARRKSRSAPVKQSSLFAEPMKTINSARDNMYEEEDNTYSPQKAQKYASRPAEMNNRYGVEEQNQRSYRSESPRETFKSSPAPAFGTTGLPEGVRHR